MTHSIDTIFVDVGATLRYVVEDKELIPMGVPVGIYVKTEGILKFSYLSP